MFSSIQFSSISSCSGVNPTAPSTPKPPALLTATTTSRQWVKAKIGNSMPSSSQMAVCMPAPGKLDPIEGYAEATETCSSLVRTSVTWPGGPDQWFETTTRRGAASEMDGAGQPQRQKRQHAGDTEQVIAADGSRQARLFAGGVACVVPSRTAFGTVYARANTTGTLASRPDVTSSQPGSCPRKASNPNAPNRTSMTIAISRLIGREVVVARW